MDNTSKLVLRHEYDQAIAKWTSEQRDKYLSKLDRSWLACGVRVSGSAALIKELFS